MAAGFLIGWGWACHVAQLLDGLHKEREEVKSQKSGACTAEPEKLCGRPNHGQVWFQGRASAILYSVRERGGIYGARYFYQAQKERAALCSLWTEKMDCSFVL